MAVTAIVISSDKIDPDNPSRIGIEEPIPYSIAVTKTAEETTEVFLVSIRLASDNSVVAQRRHTVTIPADADVNVRMEPDEFSSTDTDNLLTSRTAGNYYIHCELQSDALIYSDTGEFEVVLLSAWQVENITYAGIDLVDQRGRPIPKAVIESAINAAIKELEADLGIFIFQRRVKTSDPDGTTPADADVTVGPLHFRVDRDGYFGPILLRHNYIRSISRFDFYFGAQKILSVPPDWISIQPKSGQVHIIRGTSGIVPTGVALPFFHMFYNLGHIPDSIRVDYISGLDERHDQVFGLISEVLEHYVIMKTAPIIGDAMLLGVTSQSLSYDGVSASSGSPISGDKNLFGAKYTVAKAERDSWLKANRRKFKPMVVRTLGA